MFGCSSWVGSGCAGKNCCVAPTSSTGVFGVLTGDLSCVALAASSCMGGVRCIRLHLCILNLICSTASNAQSRLDGIGLYTLAFGTLSTVRSNYEPLSLRLRILSSPAPMLLANARGQCGGGDLVHM